MTTNKTQENKTTTKKSKQINESNRRQNKTTNKQNICSINLDNLAGNGCYLIPSIFQDPLMRFVQFVHAKGRQHHLGRTNAETIEKHGVAFFPNTMPIVWVQFLQFGFTWYRIDQGAGRTNVCAAIQSAFEQGGKKKKKKKPENKEKITVGQE